MSRVGRKVIHIPDGVEVSKNDSIVNVKGPLGQLSYKLVSPIDVLIDASQGKVVVKCESEQKKDKALYGLTRTLIANMIEGVKKGFEKVLEINGVGYNAKVVGKQLIMQLGFAHPVVTDIPENLTIQCPVPTRIVVKGIDKQAVGQFAAEIRSRKIVEPYNLKGIKYKDEIVKRKAGKTFVSGT